VAPSHLLALSVDLENAAGPTSFDYLDSDLLLPVEGLDPDPVAQPLYTPNEDMYKESFLAPDSFSSTSLPSDISLPRSPTALLEPPLASPSTSSLNSTGASTSSHVQQSFQSPPSSVSAPVSRDVSLPDHRHLPLASKQPQSGHMSNSTSLNTPFPCTFNLTLRRGGTRCGKAFLDAASLRLVLSPLVPVNSS